MERLKREKLAVPKLDIKISEKNCLWAQSDWKESLALGLTVQWLGIEKVHTVHRPHSSDSAY